MSRVHTIVVLVLTNLLDVTYLMLITKLACMLASTLVAQMGKLCLARFRLASFSCIIVS